VPDSHGARQIPEAEPSNRQNTQNSEPTAVHRSSPQWLAAATQYLRAAASSRVTYAIYADPSLSRLKFECDLDDSQKRMRVRVKNFTFSRCFGRESKETGCNCRR